MDLTRLRNALRQKITDNYERAEPVHLAKVVSISDDDDKRITVDILNPDLSTGPRRDVLGGKVRVWPGAIVRVGIDRLRHGPSELVVLGTDRVSYGAYDEPTLLELHGDDHGFDGPDEITNLHPAQVYPLRVQPYSGMTVRIQPGVFFAGGGYYYLEQTDLDLTSYRPGSGYMYAMLSVDSGSSITVTSGTTKDVDVEVTDIPLAPTGEFPLAAVRLISFQTEITRYDIVILKHLLTSDPGVTTALINQIVAEAVGALTDQLSDHLFAG